MGYLLYDNICLHYLILQTTERIRFRVNSLGQTDSLRFRSIDLDEILNLLTLLHLLLVNLFHPGQLTTKLST